MKIMRLKGLMRKEVYEIVRDPSSIAIAFVLPLALLLTTVYRSTRAASPSQRSSTIPRNSPLLS